MTTRQQRRAKAREGQNSSPNGRAIAAVLSEEQIAELQQMMQPLVLEWKIAQAGVRGYLICAKITEGGFSVDFNTGIVSLKPATTEQVGETEAVP